MKNLWFRAGVTLQLNDDEVDTILKTGADDNGNMDIVENVGSRLTGTPTSRSRR